jgi:hypothetical protein
VVADFGPAAQREHAGVFVLKPDYRPPIQVVIALSRLKSRLPRQMRRNSGMIFMTDFFFSIEAWITMYISVVSPELPVTYSF